MTLSELFKIISSPQYKISFQIGQNFLIDIDKEIKHEPTYKLALPDLYPDDSIPLNEKIDENKLETIEKELMPYADNKNAPLIKNMNFEMAESLMQHILKYIKINPDTMDIAKFRTQKFSRIIYERINQDHLNSPADLVSKEYEYALGITKEEIQFATFQIKNLLTFGFLKKAEKEKIELLTEKALTWRILEHTTEDVGHSLYTLSKFTNKFGATTSSERLKNCAEFYTNIRFLANQTRIRMENEVVRYSNIITAKTGSPKIQTSIDTKYRILKQFVLK